MDSIWQMDLGDLCFRHCAGFWNPAGETSSSFCCPRTLRIMQRDEPLVLVRIIPSALSPRHGQYSLNEYCLSRQVYTMGMNRGT